MNVTSFGLYGSSTGIKNTEIYNIGTYASQYFGHVKSQKCSSFKKFYKDVVALI
jgi:hypothetical protein